MSKDLVHHAVQDQSDRPGPFWLWRNRDHWLAYDNLYPTLPGSADPATLGDPQYSAVVTGEARDGNGVMLRAGDEVLGPGGTRHRVEFIKRGWAAVWVDDEYTSPRLFVGEARLMERAG